MLRSRDAIERVGTATTSSEREPPGDRIAVVLGGGGARAAYQVGLLRCLAELAPDFRFPIITGVSAGGINAAFLASYPGTIGEATEELCKLWSTLRIERIFRTGLLSQVRNVARWMMRLLSGGATMAPRVRGLVDTTPLRWLLEQELDAVNGEIAGIARNLEAGRLDGVAITTLNYSTGQTTTWVQGCDIQTWERPDRCSTKTRLTVDHVLASAALPLLFPAVRLGDAWHGDGGVRLAAPLAPAVHLGATRIIAVSTRHRRGVAETELQGARYPPPAQILGKLFNAIFLDIMDQDAHRLRTINKLIGRLPAHERGSMREIGIVVVRPSVDLGKLVREHEPKLPRGFRFLTRGLGTRETSSPDFLSLLMFQPDYVQRLIEIGESDARRQIDRLGRLILG